MVSKLVPKHWIKNDQWSYDLGPYRIFQHDHEPDVPIEATLFKQDANGKYVALFHGYLHECIMRVPNHTEVVKEQRELET